VKDRIGLFEPPPLGLSKEEDFDPTVHLELQEAKTLDEDEDELDQEEVDEFKDRIKVKDLNKLWLRINPC